MRRPALLLLAALLAGAGPARADATTTVTGSATAPDPVPPGSSGQATMAVRYCYGSAPVTPATIDVATKNAPAWLSATYQPERFAAEASGTCGDRDVEVTFQVGRNAPALTPGSLVVGLTSSSAGSSPQSSEATVPVQASYAAELKVATPATARVPRGDQARFDLTVSVAANGGTVMEILGRDPSGKLTIQGQSIAVAGAGRGLDQPVRDTYHVTVTASPGAALGANLLPVELTTKYSVNPSYAGGNATVQVPLDVVEANARTPAPGAGLLALGLAGGAVLLRRRA